MNKSVADFTKTEIDYLKNNDRITKRNRAITKSKEENITYIINIIIYNIYFFVITIIDDKCRTIIRKTIITVIL